MDLNTKLADNRQKAAAKYLAQQLKKAKVEAAVDNKTTAEDWEGFKKLMENSNIQDKDLVLRVLNMYSDPEERESQIKNLSAVYKNLADDVLPQLRRARLKLTTDLIGKSDDELREAVKNNPDELSLEELLYSATLTENLDEKEAIYNFYNDILTYDVDTKDGFVSKEIYVKKVSAFFEEVPAPCTADELIRAVYFASVSESRPKDLRIPNLMLGYVKADGEVVLFSSSQSQYEVKLTKDDKIIVYSTH